MHFNDIITFKYWNRFLITKRLSSLKCWNTISLFDNICSRNCMNKFQWHSIDCCISNLTNKDKDFYQFILQKKISQSTDCFNSDSRKRKSFYFNNFLCSYLILETVWNSIDSASHTNLNMNSSNLTITLTSFSLSFLASKMCLHAMYSIDWYQVLAHLLNTHTYTQ